LSYYAAELEGNIISKEVEKMKEDKDNFTMPATTETGRKKAGSPVVKEPPYRDLPADPARPPNG